MQVECVHCGAKGQIDETKIPAGVTTMKCPRCKETVSIPVTPSPDAPVVEAAPAAPSFSPPQAPPVLEAASTPEVVSTPVQLSAPSAPETAPAATCTVCSGRFSQDDMVRFGAAWVCAACKPNYVHMLAQGTPRPGEMRYAGFGIRFGAKILDGLILWVVSFLISVLVGLALPKSSPQVALTASVVAFILQTCIAAGYSGYFLSTRQATPGKMACGLTVLSPSGGQISFMRGFGRYFAELLSSMTLLIGYLMMLFDAEKRTLHDRICNTRVVYK